jgi:acetylornithine deacetylase/succinyl-diaminopimelate desuccinylase-like protein
LPDQEGFASLASDISPVLAAIDGGLEESLTRLEALLRIPSIATDPAYDGDCKSAAEWMVDYFKGLGFAAAVHATTGQPAVIAEYAPTGGAGSESRHVPHILFYGHYDVQPTVPLDLWQSPPFEPRRGKGKSGRDAIFARGAADDKGQVMSFTEACRAWLSVHGNLPFRLTVLIEGDEEGDASVIDHFVAANKAKLKADVVVVCDTGLWDDALPAIVTSLRGCVSDEVTITGPRIDLHSGYYGGAAMNPLRVLSGILGRLFDDKGRITIPGFYRDVKMLTKAERQRMASLRFDAKAYLKAVGLSISAGEKVFSPLEQMWVRPTAEVNGIWGGYIGPGGKTVIPSQAHAKLTFRTVAGQDGKHIQRCFRQFVRAQLPAAFKATFAAQSEIAMATSVRDTSPWISAAARAMEAEWNMPTVTVGAGYSIPAVESFKKHLGLDSVLMGWGRDDDAAHSPNEKYDIECFHKGMRSFTRFFHEISKGLT